ncbi:MAG: pitrilysin family protein [Bacteroidota bacterium]
MKKVLILLFVVFNFLNSQVLDRSLKPQTLATPKLKLPVMQKAKLNNGLQIILVEHHELPVVQMQMVLNCGLLQENISGVANLTANMLDEGTTKRTALEIADDISFLGSNININSSNDASFATVLTIKENLESTFEIFSDIILHPTFPEKEWDRIKKQQLASLQQQKDMPAFVASNIFSKTLFGDEHPYGRNSSGTIESVNKITIDDLKNYYKENYLPNQSTLIIVGDVKIEEVQKLVNKYLGKWENGIAKSFTISQTPTIESTKIILIDKPQAAQSEIRVGHIGVARNNEDFFALTLLNTILGGQFTSRINMNLRESKGYTYGARSGFAMNKYPGAFTISAPVKSSVTDSSLIEIMKEFNLIISENVTEKELQLAKNSIIRSLPQGFETPSQIASQISNLVVNNLPDDYYNTLVEKYSAISMEEILRVGKKYLSPNKSAIVIVGDLPLIKESIAKLNFGNIIVADSDGNKIK